MKTRVWVECSVSRAHKTWSRSLLFKRIFWGLRFERAETLVSRNACNGGKLTEGWRFKLNAKSGPLESGNFGEIGDFGNNGKMAKNRQRAGDSN